MGELVNHAAARAMQLFKGMLGTHALQYPRDLENSRQDLEAYQT